MRGDDWLHVPRTLASTGVSRTGAPCLVVTAGLHGNEPAGIHALRRVLREIETREIVLVGRLAAFVGNHRGLARNVRHVDEDMNRLWTTEKLDHLRSSAPEQDSSERGEARELLPLLERELAREPERLTHLDLHSTSGAGPPFCVVATSRESRDAAFAIGAPLLSGLDRMIAGTLIEWMGSHGHAAVVLEGGQNEARATVDHHESALWLVLVQAGVLDARSVPELERHRERIALASHGIPREVEVDYCHHLAPDEEFAMLPGFVNFDSVCEGQLLARSGPGLEREVRAPWTGTLVMPRYQGQGLDGFFLGRG